MTTINAGMRTMAGTKFLMAEIAAFEHVSTASVARPIDMPVIADEVVPSVGHMPRTSTKVGLRRTMPSSRTLVASIIIVVKGAPGTVYRVGKSP